MDFLPDLVVDTSALVAVLLPEADGPLHLDRLETAHCAAVSSVSKVELMMVLYSRQPASAEALLTRLRNNVSLSVVAVDELIADSAIAAFLRYGNGRHPAKLNFGDCFSYALAKRFNVPLLFKGDDFSQTDIPSAFTP